MKNDTKTEVTKEMAETFEKIFIIVSGPVCSGKTTLTLNLASNIENCYYLDKDDIVATSNVTFDVIAKLMPAGAKITCWNEKKKKMVVYDIDEIRHRDRHGEYFKDFIRDAEYETVMSMVIKALQMNHTILVNSPFTTELQKEAEGECKAFDEYRYFFNKEKCKFMVIFVQVDKDELRRRLETRAKEDPKAAARDPNVYEKDAEGNLRVKQSYLDGANVNPPLADGAKTKNIDEFFVFDASTDAKRDESYARLMKKLGIEAYKPYDRKIPVNSVEEYEAYLKKQK